MTKEKVCSLKSVSSEQYFACLKDNIVYPKKDQNRYKKLPPKQELSTTATVLLVFGMVICLGIAIYILKKADQPTRRVRPV